METVKTKFTGKTAIICNVAHVSEKSVSLLNLPILLHKWITHELLTHMVWKHLTFIGVVCVSLLTGLLIMFTKVAQKRCYKNLPVEKTIHPGYGQPHMCNSCSHVEKSCFTLSSVFADQYLPCLFCFL